TMPQFLEQERQHGSLWRASRRELADSNEESGARYSKFVTPRNGMGTLISANVAKLTPDCCRTNTRIESILTEANGKWSLRLNTGQVESFDAVVVATPAHHAASALVDTNRKLADLLQGIEYAGAVVVCFGFRSSQLPEPINSFGFV